MTTAAMGAMVTLLAVYAAGVIFVAQHVAERYTPALYPIVVRAVALRRIVAFAGMTLATIALAVLPSTWRTEVLSAAFVAIGVLLLITGAYSMFQAAGDRRRILDLVPQVSQEERLSALRDLVFAAVQRGDVATTEFLLAVPEHGSNEQSELLGWLTQYPQLLAQEWLALLVLRALTGKPWSEKEAEHLRIPVRRLLVHMLNLGTYAIAQEIVEAAFDNLVASPRFTQAHESIAFDITFHVHYVGEEARAVPRRGDPEPALRETQDYALAGLNSLRRAVITHRDRTGVTRFCLLLDRLGQSRIGPLHIGANVYDVLEDGYSDGLLEMEGLEALAGPIQSTRGSWDSDDEVPDSEHADELAAHLALYVVKLGGQDQVGRIVNNAGYSRGQSMPRRLAMNNGFDEDAYRTVARLLGFRRWGR